MALFGSPAAQLSPILFRGDVFAKGVNIIIHGDVSKSMNFYPYGEVNYTNIQEFSSNNNPVNTLPENSIEKTSMFYDPVIAGELHSSLLSLGVGANPDEDPNLFCYFDSRFRGVDTSNSFIIQQRQISEIYPGWILKGTASSSIENNWRNYYDTKFSGFAVGDTSIANYAYKMIEPGITNIEDAQPANVINRFDGIDFTTFQHTEDPQGIIMSLFTFKDGSSANRNETIENGVPGRYFGQPFFNDKFRKNNKTFFITASNEQENGPPDMIGYGVSTTDNINPEINRNEYNQNGLYAVRYWHYFLDSGVSDYGGDAYITNDDEDPGFNVLNEYFGSSAANNLRDRLRLGFNQLIYASTDHEGKYYSNPDTREIINWRDIDGSGTSQIDYLIARYDADSGLSYTQPGGENYIPRESLFNSSGTTHDLIREDFGRYFDLVAIPWPTGNARHENSEQAGAPTTGTNYRDPTAVANLVSSYSSGNLPDDLLNFPGIKYFDSVAGDYVPLPDPYAGTPQANSFVTNTYTTTGGITREGGSSEGVIPEINNLSSPTPNHSIVIFGYFVPQKKLDDPESSTVSYTFRLDSNEVSFLWFGDSAVSRDSSGISNWTGSGGANNATLRSKSLVQSELISNSFAPSDATGQNAGDTGGNVGEIQIPGLTPGRPYPIRILCGNRGDYVSVAGDDNGTGWGDGGTGNGSEVSGNTNSVDSNDIENASASNASFVTLSFKQSQQPNSEFTTDGRGLFFGGRSLWEEGSEFRPKAPQKVIRTLEQELQKRNISVISLSTYESGGDINISDYEGVFFPQGDATSNFEYVRFLSTDPFSYKKTGFSIEKRTTIPDWIKSSYFPPINYFIDAVNIENDDPNTMFGFGLQLSVDKNNSQYVTGISSSGNGYKVTDILNVDRSFVGEAAGTSDIQYEVVSVQPVTNNNIVGQNFVDAAAVGSGAIFNVKKYNGSGGVSYSTSGNITLVNGGSNYSVGDQLIIPGTQLDGVSPTNNVVIQVASVDAGTGAITSFLVTGTPTNFIDYSGLSATYASKNISDISYETTSINSISYDNFSVAGIAYTVIDNSNIVSIGYTYSEASYIGFTTNAIVSIGYTAPTITAIGYSAPEIVSIGYTFIQDPDIRYQETPAYSGIGYTTPSIVSIGHTAFDIVGIAWTTSRLIGFGTEQNGQDTEFKLSNSEIGAGKTLGLAEGDRVIFFDVDPPSLLQQQFDQKTLIVTRVIDDDTFTVNLQATTGPRSQKNLDPTAGFLCISKPETDLVNAAGITSSVQFTTSSPHTFKVGDSVISYGTTSSLVGTEYLVDFVPSPTTFNLAGTGRTDIFTTGFSTLTSLYSGTKSGYFNSTLELQFKTQTNNLGISSIGFDLTEYDPLIPQNQFGSRYLFDRIVNRGNTGNVVEVELQNNNIDIGRFRYSNDGQPVVDPNFAVGQKVYVFGTQWTQGLIPIGGGIDYGSTNTSGVVVGWAHTITVNGSRFIRIEAQTNTGFDNVSDGTDTLESGSVYVIPESFVPSIFLSTPSTGISSYKSGDIITISGNQNPVHNKIFKINQVSTASSATLADYTTGVGITIGDILTGLGNTSNLGGTVEYITLPDTDIRINSGDIIDTLGNTIYNLNDATVSIGNTNDYKYSLNGPIQPTELDLGLGGNAGLPSLAGFVTTTNPHGFGSAGDIINIRVFNSITGFDKLYNNALIISSDTIYLGDDSVDPQSFYTPASDAYAPTETGELYKVGDTPTVTVTGVDISTLGFNNGDLITLQNTAAFFDGTGRVISNLTFAGGNSTFNINGGTGGDLDNPTIPQTLSIDGEIGLQNSPATVTVDFDKTLQELNIGNVGDIVNARINIQDSDVAFNGSDQNIQIYGPNTFGLIDNTNPGDYTTSSTTGRVTFNLMPGIGTITGNLTSLGFAQIGSQSEVTIQDTGTVFDNSGNPQTIRIYSSNTFGLIENQFRNNTDATDVYAGSTGLLGLEGVEAILVVKNSLLDFAGISSFGNVGDLVTINVDNTGTTFDQNWISSRILNATTFSLGGSSNPLDYSTSVLNSGMIGLFGDNAFAITNGDHDFITNDIVEVNNAPNAGGAINNQNLTITKESNNRIRFNAVTSNLSTNYNDFSLVGILGLRDWNPTVRLNTAFPEGIWEGAQIKLENTDSAAFDGDYTIQNFDIGRQLFTLNGLTNPSDYTTSSTNGFIGLREAPTLTISGTNDILESEDIVIYGTSNPNFNQRFTVFEVYSPTQIGLLTPDLSEPTTFVGENVGSGGNIGVDGRDRIVTTSTSIPFNTGDEIRIQDNTVSNYNGGPFTITKIDNNTFTLDGTGLTNQPPPAEPNYSTVGTGGIFVGISSRAIVTVPAQESTSGHNLRFPAPGDSTPPNYEVVIDSTGESYFDGTFNIEVIDETRFYLNGTTSPPGGDYTISATTGNSTLQPQGGTQDPDFGGGINATFRLRRQLLGTNSADYRFISTTTTGGQGYRDDDILIIPGNLLGGSSPANDCRFRVTGVRPLTEPGPFFQPGGITNAGTGINSEAIGNNADFNMDYSDSSENPISFSGVSVLGTGEGATFDITRDGTETYSLSISNGGTGYLINDEIDFIPSTTPFNFEGKAPQNNLRIIVTNVATTAETGTTKPANSGRITNFNIVSGIASQFNPVTGITTISGTPVGLEQIGGELKQTQDMLDVARFSKGGLFKIDQVYRLGSFTKYSKPEIIYWPAMVSRDYPNESNTGKQGWLIFDTQGGSGIATISLRDDSNDNDYFTSLDVGDEVFILGTRHTSIDYPYVGYAHTIVGIANTIPYSGGLPDQDDSVYHYITIDTNFRTNNRQFNTIEIANGNPKNNFNAQFSTDFDSQVEVLLEVDRLLDIVVIDANADAKVVSAEHGLVTGDQVVITCNDSHPGLAQSVYTITTRQFLLEPEFTTGHLADPIEDGQNFLEKVLETPGVSKIGIGETCLFTIDGFTPKKYLSQLVRINSNTSDDYTTEYFTDNLESSISPRPVANGGPYQPNENPVKRYLLVGGTDEDGTGLTLGVDNLSGINWNPSLDNGDVGTDQLQRVLENGLSKLVIGYNNFNNVDTEAYVGIGTVDNRIAFARALAQYISENSQ